MQEDDEAILRALGDVRSAKVLVLNKVDLVEKPALLTLTQTLNERVAFAATFMISALSGSGVADLKSWFAAHVPPGPWLYPEDQISDAPLRQLAAEITREKLYLRLHQELPYQSTVETEVWKELRDGSVRIEQTIYVERESQRKIVLGKGGQAIKAIGAAARDDIAAADRAAGASVPVRQGAGRLGRRSGALSRNGPGIPEGVIRIARGRARYLPCNGPTKPSCSASSATARRSVILELMTLEHGRHLGLVRGGASTRLRGVLQPGNSLRATWRARLDEHLGNYTVEGLNLRAAGYLSAAHAVHGVTHLAALVPAPRRA